jgi:Ca2+-binding RTX toxin-like protein
MQHDRHLPLAEALESRRLLAVTLNEATGVLEITAEPGDDGNPADNEILFEDVSDDDGRAFVVTQAVEDGEAESFGPFDVSDVFYVDIQLSGGNDTVIVGNKAFIAIDVDAGGGNDSISGGRLNDTILGNAGDDYLFGGGGNDILTGGDDSDLILGGDGDLDTADYRDESASLNITLDGVANDGASGEEDNVELDIERVIGGSGADTISAESRPLIGVDEGVFFIYPPVAFFGGPGNDTLRGADATPEAVEAAANARGIGLSGDPLPGDTLVGDSGADNLIGNGGDDLLLGDDNSNDTLSGGEGRDILNGNLGDGGDGEVLLQANIGRLGGQATSLGILLDSDGTLVVNGSDGDDEILIQRLDDRANLTDPDLNERYQVAVLRGDGTRQQRDFGFSQVNFIVINAGAGDDLVYVAAAPNQTFASVPVNARIQGGEGDDTLIGGDGDDDLDGGSGNNFLLGGGGNDTLTAGFGSDYLSGGNGGEDRVDYGSRSDEEPLRVGIGRVFDDGYIANENDNVVIDVEVVVGGAGDDVISTITNSPVSLFGQGGNDTLFGGNGSDFLSGGEGRDLLIGGNGSDFFTARDGTVDVIVTGSGNDNGTFDEIDEIDFS